MTSNKQEQARLKKENEKMRAALGVATIYITLIANHPNPDTSATARKVLAMLKDTMREK